METDDVLQQIGKCGIMAVIRLKENDVVREVANALLEGGVNILEITLTVPGAVQIIQDLRNEFGGRALVGAGTVMSAKDATQVIDAGSQFVVSPIFRNEIIDTCKKRDVVILPGCFTPTEMFMAWQRGADLVKLFPATKLGPQFIKDVRGPMPEIKIVPTGGVSLENTAEFIQAGAFALGVGTALLNKTMIQNHDWDSLSDRAKQFRSAVESGRFEKQGHLA